MGGHDAGDLSPNAYISNWAALAGFGTVTWISVEEAATLLNVSVAELTPAKFDIAYAAAWEANDPSDETTTTVSGGAERRISSVTVSLLVGAFTVMVM